MNRIYCPAGSNRPSGGVTIDLRGSSFLDPAGFLTHCGCRDGSSSGFLSAARSSWINRAAPSTPTAPQAICSFLGILKTSVSWHLGSIRHRSSAGLCLRRYSWKTGRSRIKAVTAVTATIGIIERLLGGPKSLLGGLQAGDSSGLA
jgi:hypothetical protein